MNYKMVGFVLGRIFLIEAALMLFPMGCAAIYGEWSVVLSFLWPALIVLALGALSVHITGFDFGVLVKKGSKFFDILAAMFPPNTGYLSKIWQPLWDTIKMSFLGSFIGAVLAIPFAVAAASNIVTNRVVVFIVRLFLSLVRTLPTLVCALIATYIFGLGTMAGTCAIAVFTFAYVGKQLFEIILSLIHI